MTSLDSFKTREINLDDFRDYVDVIIMRKGDQVAPKIVLLESKHLRELLPPGIAVESTSVMQNDHQITRVYDFVTMLVNESIARNGIRGKRSNKHDSVCWLLTPEETEAVLVLNSSTGEGDLKRNRDSEVYLTDPKNVGSMMLQVTEAASLNNSESLTVALKCASVFIELFAAGAKSFHLIDEMYPEIKSLANACNHYLDMVNKLDGSVKLKERKPVNELFKFSDPSTAAAVTAGQVSATLARTLEAISDQNHQGSATGSLAASLASTAAHSQVIDLSGLLTNNASFGKLIESLSRATTIPNTGGNEGDDLAAEKQMAITRNQAIQAAFIQAAIQAQVNAGVAAQTGGGRVSLGGNSVATRGKKLEPSLTLAMHIRFLEQIEKKLVLNDRKSRDWSALEKILALDSECPVKHVKQKAKRVLQERRSRLQLRFWEKIKAANDIDRIRKLLIDMIGKHVWADDQFLSCISDYLLSLVRAGKRSPGNILEWTEIARTAITHKLLFLHREVYPNLPFNHIHEHLKDLFSSADIEIGLLSVCDCRSCVEDWHLSDVNRASEPQLRVHWSREKAGLLRIVLQVHQEFSESQFHIECKRRAPKLRNWSKADIDALLRAAHPVEECERCVKSRLDLASKPVKGVLAGSGMSKMQMPLFHRDSDTEDSFSGVDDTPRRRKGEYGQGLKRPRKK